MIKDFKTNVEYVPQRVNWSQGAIRFISNVERTHYSETRE